MSNILLAGLMGGLEKYGQMREAEKEKEETALAKAAEEARALRLKALGLSLEAPKYQSFDDVVGGQPGKRTVRQKYDAVAGWQEEDLGFKPDAPKAPQSRTITRGDESVTQEWTPDGGWVDVASGPKFRPARAGGGGDGGGGDDGMTADQRNLAAYMALSPEERDAYDRMKGRTPMVDPDELEKRELAKEARGMTNDALKAFAKLNPFEKQEALRAAGIDPNDPKAETKYRRRIRDESNQFIGAPMFDRAKGGVKSTAPILQSGQANKGSREHPIPAEQFTEKPPAGTWVRLPDGRVIQVGA